MRRRAVQRARGTPKDDDDDYAERSLRNCACKKSRSLRSCTHENDVPSLLVRRLDDDDDDDDHFHPRVNKRESASYALTLHVAAILIRNALFVNRVGHHTPSSCGSREFVISMALATACISLLDEGRR